MKVFQATDLKHAGSAFLLMICLLLISCTQETPSSESDSGSLLVETLSEQQEQKKRYRAAPEKQAYVAHVRLQTIKQLSKAVESAQRLQETVETFLANPQTGTLDQARLHWQQAYHHYLRSLAATVPQLSEPQEWQEARLTSSTFREYLHSYPIEPGYIDYVEGYPVTGIINDTVLRISESNLVEQHLFAGDFSASIGFHAIEFLLWGELGERPVSDYVVTETTSEVINQGRRRQYLKLAVKLLNTHLTRLAIRWDQDNGYYSLSLGSQIADDVLMNSLANIRQLISTDLPQGYLQEEHHPFSQLGRASAAALVEGVQELILPTEADTGMRPLLADTPNSQLRVQNSLMALSACLKRPQALPAEPDVEAQQDDLCQGEIIELLSDLDEIKIHIKQL